MVMTAAGEAAARRTRRYPSAGTFLWAFMAVVFAYVMVHNERFLLDPLHPRWSHIAPFKYVLLLHGVAGGAALLLGPLQFSDSWRKSHTWAHRVAGRIYIAGSLIAAPLGAYIQHLDEATGDPRSYTVAASVQGTIWAVSSLLALWFIRGGRVQLHRQWMTRSMAIGPGVFLMSRFVDGVTGLGAVPDFDLAITFACIALAVPVADVITHWSEIRRV